MIVVDMEIVGQEVGRIGDPTEVADVKSEAFSGQQPVKQAPVQAYRPAPIVNDVKPAYGQSTSGAVKQESKMNVFPIGSLNPYQNKCVFCTYLYYLNLFTP